MPQFSQLFHGAHLPGGRPDPGRARLVHGRWWAVGVALVSFGFMLMGVMDEDARPSRSARAGRSWSAPCWSRRRRWRSGPSGGCASPWPRAWRSAPCLAAEWWWNQGAPQPWTASLLPEALLGVVGAVGAAVLEARCRRAIAGERAAPVPVPAVVVAGVACPRRGGPAAARGVGGGDLQVEAITGTPGMADVEVTLTPAGAADDAYWFQATAWQGGGLVLLPWCPPESRALPQRGADAGRRPPEDAAALLPRGEMMAVPVWFPADLSDEGQRRSHGDIAPDAATSCGRRRTRPMACCRRSSTACWSPPSPCGWSRSRPPSATCSARATVGEEAPPPSRRLAG